MPVNEERVAWSIRMWALRVDDHAVCLALWALCDGVAMHTWATRSIVDSGSDSMGCTMRCRSWITWMDHFEQRSNSIGIGADHR